MNPYYHYQYSNGLQFVSRASYTLLNLYLKNKNTEIPKLIGVWRFKEFINNKNKKNVRTKRGNYTLQKTNKRRL